MISHFRIEVSVTIMDYFSSLIVLFQVTKKPGAYPNQGVWLSAAIVLLSTAVQLSVRTRRQPPVQLKCLIETMHLLISALPGNKLHRMICLPEQHRCFFHPSLQHECMKRKTAILTEPLLQGSLIGVEYTADNRNRQIHVQVVANIIPHMLHLAGERMLNHKKRFNVRGSVYREFCK